MSAKSPTVPISPLKVTLFASQSRDARVFSRLPRKPEKPPYKVRGCGIYLFRPEIFKFIINTQVNQIRKEKDITTTINNIAKEKKAYGYFIDGYNININNSDELLKANILVKKFLDNKNKKPIL